MAHACACAPTCERFLVLHTLKAPKHGRHYSITFCNRQGVAGTVLVISQFSCLPASGSNRCLLRAHPPMSTQFSLPRANTELYKQLPAHYSHLYDICICVHYRKFSPLLTSIKRQNLLMFLPTLCYGKKIPL